MSKWQLRKVGKVFDVQLGKMLNKKAKEGEMYPYLANFNVQWGRFDFSKMNEMNFNERERDKYELRKNDLLMCEGGEIGRCAVWQKDNLTCFYQKALHRLRARDVNEINPYFFYAYMEYICSTNVLIKIVGETSIAHLTREKLLELKFPCPQKHLQDQIVDTLQTWDTAIEKTEALIAAKERQFGWLRSHIIKNAKNTNGQKFGDFLKESRIPDTINNPEKRLTVRLHLKGVDIREYRGTESDGATQYYVRKAGQLVYGKQNIFRGSIGVVPKALDGYSSSQDIPAFDVGGNVNAEWLFCYMSRPSFYEKLEHFSAGSGSKRLHPKELFKMHIDVPSLEEQKRISHTLNTAQQEITLLKKLADQYRTQKRGLMQKLLSGQWHIKNKEVA